MPPPGTPQPTDGQPTRRPGALLAAISILVVVGLLSLFVFLIFTAGPKNISYNQFLELVKQGALKEITFIGKTKMVGEVRDPNVAFVKDELKLTAGRFSVVLPTMENQNGFIAEIQAIDAAKNLVKKDPNSTVKAVKINVEEDQGQWIGPILYTLLPLLLLGTLFLFLFPRMRDPMGGGFASSFTKSNARRVDKSMNKTTFADVAGMDNAKRELQEVVEFLKSPERFHRLGAQVPKGVLLVGPPGTGKTLLARAVAGEAGVPFFNINGSEFIQMFVGVGASRVRDLFRTAKENSPCLIFIDEIDAVGRMRGAGVGGGSDEREQTLNQILGEMDGFSTNESVIVLAATNRPDVLDAALLRPGRFDRHVTVDRPTWQGRIDILKVHVRNKPLGQDVNLEKIGKKAIGMSGADLRNLANEAAIVAAQENKERVDAADFDKAIERIMFGARRENSFTPEEQRRTAYHEAGHALCGWLQPKADPLWKISILPRGQAAGVTVSMPDEDRVDLSQTELMAKLVVCMGGRAADRLMSNELSSGAIQDLKQATRIARMMVTQFGMSERLGPVAYRAGEEHVFLGKEIYESRDFSEGTARVIDEEVQRILRESEEEATRLLTENRHMLDQLTDALVKQEELERDDVEKLLGPRPGVTREEELNKLPPNTLLPN
jgi:cell division protease FtsH